MLLSPSYTMEYHFQWFSRLCSSLEGYTHTCVISFLDMYRKIKGRMERIQTRAMTGEDMVSLASFMGPEIAGPSPGCKKRQYPEGGMRLCQERGYRRLQHLSPSLQILLCEFQPGSGGGKTQVT